jgi:hypothetical protein
VHIEVSEVIATRATARRAGESEEVHFGEAALLAKIDLTRTDTSSPN